MENKRSLKKKEDDFSHTQHKNTRKNSSDKPFRRWLGFRADPVRRVEIRDRTIWRLENTTLVGCCSSLKIERKIKKLFMYGADCVVRRRTY